jgi:hypothetical protein
MTWGEIAIAYMAAGVLWVDRRLAEGDALPDTMDVSNPLDRWAFYTAATVIVVIWPASLIYSAYMAIKKGSH